jgi:hypothetical protein
MTEVGIQRIPERVGILGQQQDQPVDAVATRPRGQRLSRKERLPLDVEQRSKLFRGRIEEIVRVGRRRHRESYGFTGHGSDRLV